MGGDSGGSDIIPTTISATPVTYPQQAYNEPLGSLYWQGNNLKNYNSWSLNELFNNFYAPFMKGQYNVQNYPGFASAYDTLRGSMEGQYGQARENILASSPRGGAMTDALAGLENSRARNTGLGTSQLSSSILNNLWSGANNLATGSLPSLANAALSSGANTSQSGINQAQQVNLASQVANQNADLTAAKANQSANLAAQQANLAADTQSKSSGLGTLGTGIGSIAGLAMAPFTGGTSLLGSATSGLSGLTSGLSSGKGGSSLFNMGNTGYGSAINNIGLSYY